MNYINRVKIRTLGFILLIVLVSCNRRDKFEEIRTAGRFQNLNDTVKYVGMHVCKGCHLNVYKQYIRTGMGQSFDTATPLKSAAVIGEDSMLYDSFKDLYYKPYWNNDSLKIKEFRKVDNQIAFERTEYVNFIIGSGQHTNSHIYLSGKYAYQVPFTYYTQDGRFDFPPGFENGANSRFSRKIGLECMSCHNGFPDFVRGSENKYSSIPDGIDCERCHGPGELHVKLKKKGFIVDTSQFTDYTIVNPANLSLQLQSDVCARCHLQGTMVLKPGKSFYDFKPGMKLTSVMDIFMPVYSGGHDDFIMASHFERMVQSNCYIESNGGFSCIGCHNPHISHIETNSKYFNKLCIECHNETENSCREKKDIRLKEENNCTHCHMPESYTRDILHVRIHDHKISIPKDRIESKSEKIFEGLQAINNPAVDHITRARGYIKEFETYNADPQYLDSACYYLNKVDNKNLDYYFNACVNYHYLKNEYNSITQLVGKKGLGYTLDSLLNKPDYSNYDAWTSYRIGQAFENKKNTLLAGYFYQNAIMLAPFNLEFQNKFGSHLLYEGKLQEAKKIYSFILDEDPRYTAAWANLSTLYLKLNNYNDAKRTALEALKLNPDHLQALINLAGIYTVEDRRDLAADALKRIKRINPESEIAKSLSKRLHF